VDATNPGQAPLSRRALLGWALAGGAAVAFGAGCGVAVGTRPRWTSTPLVVYAGHRGGVATLGWSPDGAHIASGGWDGTAQVWEAATGHPALTYRGHPGSVNTLGWSPDGARIASGASDRTAQVWEAATGKQVVVYGGHRSDVTAVAWSPDGARVASAGRGDDAQVWTAR